MWLMDCDLDRKGLDVRAVNLWSLKNNEFSTVKEDKLWHLFVASKAIENKGRELEKEDTLRRLFNMVGGALLVVCSPLNCCSRSG